MSGGITIVVIILLLCRCAIAVKIFVYHLFTIIRKRVKDQDCAALYTAALLGLILVTLVVAEKASPAAAIELSAALRQHTGIVMR